MFVKANPSMAGLKVISSNVDELQHISTKIDDALKVLNEVAKKDPKLATILKEQKIITDVYRKAYNNIKWAK